MKQLKNILTYTSVCLLACTTLAHASCSAPNISVSNSDPSSQGTQANKYVSCVMSQNNYSSTPGPIQITLPAALTTASLQTFLKAFKGNPPRGLIENIMSGTTAPTVSFNATNASEAIYNLLKNTIQPSFEPGWPPYLAVYAVFTQYNNAVQSTVLDCSPSSCYTPNSTYQLLWHGIQINNIPVEKLPNQNTQSNATLKIEANQKVVLTFPNAFNVPILENCSKQTSLCVTSDDVFSNLSKLPATDQETFFTYAMSMLNTKDQQPFFNYLMVAIANQKLSTTNQQSFFNYAITAIANQKLSTTNQQSFFNYAITAIANQKLSTTNQSSLAKVVVKGNTQLLSNISSSLNTFNKAQKQNLYSFILLVAQRSLTADTSPPSTVTNTLLKLLVDLSPSACS